MAEPTDRDPTEQRGRTIPRTCPLCGDHCPQYQSPRHGGLLEDEADDTQSRIVSCSVCPTCWETLYTALTEEGVMPVEFYLGAGKG